MAKQTSRKIDTNEVALRIQDELNDFHIEGLVSTQINNKKSRFVNLIRAINHADRVITRDMNLESVVVLYAPADTNNIIFSQNADYAKEIYDNIDGQSAELINNDLYYFIGRDQYIDILTILDRFVYIYDSYPTGATKPSGKIKLVGHADFQESMEDLGRIDSDESYLASPYYEESREIDSYCYLVPDDGRLVLEQQFASAKFLTFKARLMPGIVGLKDLADYDRDSTEYDVYKIKTPHWGMELLVYEALDWLLPVSAVDAKALVQKQKNIQKIGFENSKPGNSNVVVPHFSWG